MKRTKTNVLDRDALRTKSNDWPSVLKNCGSKHIGIIAGDGF